MLTLYCLPGRLFANISYFFPGSRRAELTATARRRESSFAHFILATPFWILVGLFGWAYISSAIQNISQPFASRSVGVSEAKPQAAPDVVVDDAASESFASARKQDRFDGRPAVPVGVSDKPQMPIFAPRHEIVQAIPDAPSEKYLVCSATITDHCVEK